jgi:hypothetical protein
VERLLAQPYVERWAFAGDGMQAVFSIPMDKAWVVIHRARSDVWPYFEDMRVF